MATSESIDEPFPSADHPQEDVKEEDVVRMMAILDDQEEDNQLPQEGDEGDVLDENQNQDDFETDHIPMRKISTYKLSYFRISFLLAVGHIMYALRSREQMYLAFLYMTNSKLSYIIIGNGIVALLINVFQTVVRIFLNGLRLMESEAIIDHCRWNVTETCIVLTMFRQDLSSSVIVLFLYLVMIKCLHWAVELRVNHLRMTQDAFYFLDSDDEPIDSNPSSVDNHIPVTRRSYWTISYISPRLPRIRMNHIMLIALMMLLYMVDLITVTFCVSRLLQNGPNVVIIFLFESAVLVISVMSSFALYGIHFFDGFINSLQKLVSDNGNGNKDIEVSRDDNGGEIIAESNASQMRTKQTYTQIAVQKTASIWRDQRITTTFFVELMGLAAKFLFHLILFGAIFALYGLPINIIRDFYMAFVKLKNRLIAFASYRALTSNMNTRFKSVTTEKELEEAGKTCIICRDQMEIDGINGDCKQLPMCNHVFHKHCLREWLVQQQTCPTCRGDIQKNEARAKTLQMEHSDEPCSNVEVEADMIDANSEPARLDRQEHSDIRDSENKEHNLASDSTVEIIDPNSKHPTLCRVCSQEAEASIFDDHFSKVRTLAHNTLIICYLEQCMQHSDKRYIKTLDGWIEQQQIEICTKLSK